MSRRWPDELRLAFLLLSRLPVGAIPGEAPPMAASGWAWPVVGAVLGLIAGLAHALALSLGLTPEMAAVLAVAVLILASGGMHEDGLADLADGFGGGRDRDRKLSIMRDSRIGSYGAVALVLALAFRLSGLAALPDSGVALAALLGLGAASRAVLPAALYLMPAARDDGLGRAAASADARPAMIAAALGLACLLPLGAGTALLAALVIAGAATLLAAVAVRQIGGQTGDVLGAMQQVAECAGWAALVATL